MPPPPKLPPRVFKLRNGVKNYEWGKRGSDSLAGRLATHVTCNGIKMNEDEYYAELWMGTHPNCPSYALLDFVPHLLSDLIAQDPTLVGPPELVEKFPSLREGQLPFLFKVLSCRKALPLQVHPDQRLAQQLVESDQKGEFVDANHKPEIAIAVDSFQGFVGFLPHQEIRDNLEAFITEETLNSILGGKEKTRRVLDQLSAEDEMERKAALKVIFAAFLELEEGQVQTVLQEKGNRGGASHVGELIERLNEQYPGDPGVLAAPLFLNYSTLEPGEALFAEANGIHAWLSGDMLECMATSGNVVNAALAPKDPKDVDRFKSMLAYRSQPSDAFRVASTCFPRAASTHFETNIPCRCRSFTTLIDAPTLEFKLLRCKLPFEGAAEEMEALEGPSIVLTIAGCGKLCANGTHYKLDTGESWFIGAGVETKWKAWEDGWEFYRVFVEP